MILRLATKYDIHELVGMYKDLIFLTHHKPLNSDFYFYKEVISWFDLDYDVVVSVNNTDITGFYVCFLNDNSFLIDRTYHAHSLYIKEPFRNSKAFYLMQKNIIKTAKDNNIDLVADGVPFIKNIYKKLGGGELVSSYVWRFKK